MAIQPEVLHRNLELDLAEQGIPYSKGTWPDMTLKEAFASSLANSLTKKYVVSVKPDADARALRKFLACNTSCQNWELRIDKIDSKIETILGELKRVIDGFWYKNGYSLVDHPYDLLHNARVGPGVSRYSSGNDFYSKLFSSKLSCSNKSLYFWYKRYASRFAEWSNAESIRTLHFGEPHVTSSKLSFVPKNDEISRCICIEPSLNTYFQLGFEHILLARLKDRFGIDLKSQQVRNRDLARLGSITDGLSTIDLSSASDSISLKMLQWLLPEPFLRELVKYRTPAVEIEGVGTVPLHMISTMGNGYTFPLQCIIFAGVVIACLRFRGLPALPWDQGYQSSSDCLWGVNGDDIVCPKLITSDVISVLNLLGFSVNDDKSFVEGPFRESCGADFFNGVDIRGVYIQDLASHASLYSVINQLTRFSTRSGISLRHLIGFLLSRIPKSSQLFVPRSESFSSGIHVPSWLERVRKLKVDKRTKAEARYLQAKAYYILAPEPVQLKVTDSYVITPKGCKPRIYNPSGLLISFLQGTISSSKIGVRVDALRWRRKRRFSSSWDAEPSLNTNLEHLGPYRLDRGRQDYGLDWRRWEIVAYTLFSS